MSDEHVILLPRPAGLRLARRFIRWEYEFATGRRISLPALDRKELSDLASFGHKLGGPTGTDITAKARHCANGCTVSVSEEVSRAMERTHLDCAPENIRLPAESMEIIFQDRSLPSVLVAGIKDREGVPGFIFIIDAKEGDGTETPATWVLALPYEKAAYLTDAREQLGNLPHTAPLDDNLTDEESAAMRFAALLVLKVLAYAQLPGAQAELFTHAQRREAGLLEGAKHRPAGPAFSVRYLPRPVRTVHVEPAEPSGQHRRFLGRSGHLRYFRAERYVNVRHTWKYIAPVMPPPGTKVIYKVRYDTEAMKGIK